MENTNGLLANLVQTKSIERVLAPIANQVAQLILLNESFEKGDSPSVWPQLQETAVSVEASAEKLTRAATRMTHEAGDEELQVQMPSACERLVLAGQGFVVAARRAEDENFMPPTRRQLIRSAKDVFEGTLKVLLVMDDAEVRKLIKCTAWVLERLADIATVHDMNDLIQKFKALTESVLLLTNLARRRQQELSNPLQRERLLLALASLRKWLPLLSTAAHTYIKYPDNAQAKTGQEYAVGQVIECVHEVKAAVENRHLNRLDDEEPTMQGTGHFQEALTKLSEVLSLGCRGDLDISQLECSLEQVVRHSMVVAHLSSEQHRSRLSRSCQRALHQKTESISLYKDARDNPDYDDLWGEYEEACDCLLEELHDLGRHVHWAVTELVVIALKETTEPIERLLQAALQPDSTEKSVTFVSPESWLTSQIDAFHAHSDYMCQIIDLLAAGTSQVKEVRQMRSCLQQLERLDPELVPATMSCHHDNQDQAARRHLRMLKVEWCRSVELMMTAVDDIIDKAAFIRIADEELQSDVAHLNTCIHSDDREILKLTRPVIGGARRVTQVATGLIAGRTDVKLRNKAATYINQTIKVTSSVKSAAKGFQKGPPRVDTLQKRCGILLRCVAKLRSFLAPDDPEKERHSPADLQPLSFDLEEEDEGELGNTEPPLEFRDSNPVESAAPDVPSQQALKEYVASLTTPRIKELVVQLVTAAIAGQQRKVDLLSNQVLAECNHVTELANQMAACSDNNKKQLETWSSEVISLTPQLIDKACKVIAMDTYELEPLHKVAEEWVKLVSSLEQLIDTVLASWREVSEKVVDAARLANTRLVAAQVQYINSHVKSTHEYVTAACRSIDTGNVVAMETAHQLRDAADDLDSVTAMLSTLADVTLNSGKEDDKQQLQKVGREWACRIYCIIATIERLCLSTIHRVKGPPMKVKWDNFTEVRRFVRCATEENLAWKELLGEGLQKLSHDTQIRRAASILDEMDVLTSSMDDCSQVLSTTSSTLVTIDKYYAPCRMVLLYSQWAQKTVELQRVCDIMVLEHWAPTKALAHQPGGESSVEAAEALVLSVLRSQERASRLLHISNVPTARVNVMKHFTELDAASQKLRERLKSAHGSSGALSIEDLILWGRRQWAFGAWGVTRELERAGLDPSEVADILKPLRSQQQMSDQPSIFNDSSVLERTKSSPASATSDVPSTTSARSSRVQLPTDPQSSMVSNLMADPQRRQTRPVTPSGSSGYKANKATPGKKSIMSGLKWEADQWEDSDNPIVSVAQQMAQQLAVMAEVSQIEDDDVQRQNKEELILAAKAITKSGDKLVQFAKILAKYCRDKRCKKELLQCVDHVPSVATQLNILASVKAATPEDRTAEKMLLHNTASLMDAVTKMLKAAEAASVKGFLEPPSEAKDETEAVVLATQWRRKLDIHRERETIAASKDALGLRKVNRSSPAPTLGRIKTKLAV